MEEHTTMEMLGQNNATETLKYEVEVLVGQNAKLSTEVARLSSEASEVADLRLKVVSFRDNKERAEGEVARLKRQVEEAQMSEILAVERTSKANETCDNLHNALYKEQQSGAALQEQVSLLRKQMEALEGLALITAETYKAAVEKFGGQTSVLPEEASSFNLLTWLKSHIEKVPFFVGGAMDFAALASATNFGKMLMQKGCTHATEVGHESLADASSLGKASDALRKSVHNFIGSFWTLFGRASARQMAEEHHAKVFWFGCTFPCVLIVFDVLFWLCRNYKRSERFPLVGLYLRPLLLWLLVLRLQLLRHQCSSLPTLRRLPRRKRSPKARPVLRRLRRWRGLSEARPLLPRLGMVLF
jgi:cell division septum initiation protein DivIVA